METPISMHHILFTLQGWLTLDVVSSLCEVNVLLKASLKWPSCPSGAMLWGRVGGSGWVVGARCWVAQLPASAGEHWGGGGGGGEGGVGEEEEVRRTIFRWVEEGRCRHLAASSVDNQPLGETLLPVYILPPTIRSWLSVGGDSHMWSVTKPT